MTSRNHRLHWRGLLVTLALVTLSIVSSTLGATAASAHTDSHAVLSLSKHQHTQSSLLPAILSGTPFNLKNFNSGQCLDVVNRGTQNGDRLQQWTCFSPATQNQTWTANKIGSTSNGFDIIQIKESGTNECLDALNRGVSNGTPIQIFQCLSGSGHDNQHWLVDPNASTSAIQNLLATNTRNFPIVLDVECDSSTNNGLKAGAKVQLWQENSTSACGGDNELWTPVLV